MKNIAIKEMGQEVRNRGREERREERRAFPYSSLFFVFPSFVAVSISVHLSLQDKLLLNCDLVRVL